MSVRILTGDCRDVLASMPAGSVQCCVTSPPYFGLRDYGHAAQIGLEPTPDAYVAEMVAVFREVRRILRDDGVIFLNLGDSYASSTKGTGGDGSSSGLSRDGRSETARVRNAVAATKKQSHEPTRIDISAAGLKPKDLIGIPWLLAFALREPYYTGAVKNEMDRVWLGAMLDAEGCICGSEYQSNEKTKTNLYIGITNSSMPIIEKCGRVFPQEKENVYTKGGLVNRTVYRWDVERRETKSLFLREVYPYLVAKKKQAIIGYTFLEMQLGLPSKKKGYLPAQQEQRSWMIAALSTLNKGGDVDLPDWMIEPPSLFEPGFYLRQENIWAKKNPMPESVTDRCTKAHESVFLLTKSAQYYWDAKAIAEPAIRSGEVLDYTGDQKANTADDMQRTLPKGRAITVGDTRNKRSVWSIASQPYIGAHFATMPPELAETCIKAGSSERGQCPTCGAPWVRLVERTATGRGVTSSKLEDGINTRSSGKSLAEKRQAYRELGMEGPPPHITTGWAPSCGCPMAPPVPQTILDPFGGAGTTGLVADRLQRNAVLIELNPKYAELARTRIDDEAGMFAGAAE